MAIHTDDAYDTLTIRDVKDLWQVIDKHMPTCVIFEDFRTAGRIDTNGLATVRLVGAIEAVTYRLNIPTIQQFPAERKQFIDIARSMLNASTKRWVVHELDALAHLLVYEHRLSQGTLEYIMSTRRKNT